MALLPLIEYLLPLNLPLVDALRPVFILSILGIGLNIITGFAGILHLGVAAFMAIGAYTYAILTCEIYPFQIGFFWGIVGSVLFAATMGAVLGLPTLRLRGDYL